jgi:transposase-like protein
VWADGIYVKAGLENNKAAMLVVIAALRDGRKVVLAVESGYRESTDSWATLLRDLKARGLRAPRLLIADGHLGIWGAVRTVFPAVSEQRCWNHRLMNVLDTLPKKLQAEARALLTQIPYAETRAEAERQKRAFQAWATKKDVAAAGRRLEEDWERLVTFYAFPEGALEASPDDERGGIAVRGRAAADRVGQAVQEGGEHDGDHLEDVAGRRADLPPAGRA